MSGSYDRFFNMFSLRLLPAANFRISRKGVARWPLNFLTFDTSRISLSLRFEVDLQMRISFASSDQSTTHSRGRNGLEFFDRDTLERVVCLVRRWSQNRIAARQETSHSALDDGPSFRIPSFHASKPFEFPRRNRWKSLPDLTSKFVNASHGMPRLCSLVIP